MNKKPKLQIAQNAKNLQSVTKAYGKCWEFEGTVLHFLFAVELMLAKGLK